MVWLSRGARRRGSERPDLTDTITLVRAGNGVTIVVGQQPAAGVCRPGDARRRS
jgi:hypothetical protein